MTNAVDELHDEWENWTPPSAPSNEECVQSASVMMAQAMKDHGNELVIIDEDEVIGDEDMNISATM